MNTQAMNTTCQSTALARGTIVFSKKGRDKGKAMVVLESDDGYLILADGKMRTLERPKKKKAKACSAHKRKGRIAACLRASIARCGYSKIYS